MKNNNIVTKSGNLMCDGMIVNGDQPDIRSMIYTIRGVQVMLDRDLAMLYGVATGALNQAVKRNSARFPERFMFQMSPEEFANWKSQSVISNLADGASVPQSAKLRESTVRMGLRKKPFVFTEHGVTMLAAVLRSDTAVRMSIKIIDAFVAMRRTLASIGPVLARIETVERRQITDQSRNEARFDEILRKMGESEVPDCQIFYQNRFWDAKSLLVRIIRRAKKELIVVDAYPGVAMLDILAKRGRGVKIELITHSNGELEESDFEAFGKQCGKFTKSICGICHDRFIIIDNVEIYSIGASLKDVGRLTFGVSKMGDFVIPGLLANLRNATSVRKEYAK